MTLPTETPDLTSGYPQAPATVPAMTTQGIADVQTELLAEARKQTDDLRAARIAVQIIAGLLLLLVLVGFIAIAGGR